jgi:hypothetical protein
MTAKKNTTKSTKSPAPATKSSKSTTRKTTATAIAATPAPRAAAPAPVPVQAAEVTPAVVTKLVEAVVATPQPVTIKPLTTTIIAVLDVGFGNALFIRGEGAGLSWDQGVQMTCLAPNHWEIALGESARGYTFKVLVNDLTWSTGPDYYVESGGTLTISPQF